MGLQLKLEGKEFAESMRFRSPTMPHGGGFPIVLKGQAWSHCRFERLDQRTDHAMWSRLWLRRLELKCRLSTEQGSISIPKRSRAVSHRSVRIHYKQCSPNGNLIFLYLPRLHPCGFAEAQPRSFPGMRRRTGPHEQHDRGIPSAYELARERFAAIGVDTEAAIRTVRRIPISIQCWQGDDVRALRTLDAN